MSRNDYNASRSGFMSWFRAAILTFALGIASGGALIPFLHFAVCGQSDPFQHGWPLCLQLLAFLLSLVIAISLRCSATVAFGVYLGLVGWMLATGGAEYPVSAAIALLVHGFLPGAFGSAFAFAIMWALAKRRPPPTSEPPA